MLQLLTTPHLPLLKSVQAARHQCPRSPVTACRQAVSITMQLIYNVHTFAALALALPSTEISKLNESNESISTAPKQCRAGQRYCFSEVLNELSMHLKTPFHIFSSMSCFQSLVLTANSWSSASDIAQKKTSRSSSTNTATRSIKTTGIAAIPARGHGP